MVSRFTFFVHVPLAHILFDVQYCNRGLRDSQTEQEDYVWLADPSAMYNLSLIFTPA